MKKFGIILLANIFFDVLLLFLGDYFLLMTFSLGVANMLVMGSVCKKENRKHTALFSLILALFLTMIPIAFAYLFGDAGAVAFMIIFTVSFVTIPLLIFSIFTLAKSKIKQNHSQ